MDHSVFYHPGLTIALALALGMFAQSLAYHLRVPGIVLLLLAGVIFGPDVLGVIHPMSLGPGLNVLTGFAVAVILFEGGLNLKFKRLKRAQRSIRQLILLGGLVTIIGAAVAVHYAMAWPWQTALLFGTLVMVTGPTVINPLLKRLRVKRGVATVLEAEGVLIDAVGAVVAIVALEAALRPAHGTPIIWVWHVFSRLGFGALCGAIAGWLFLGFYRVQRLIPEGMENVFTLSAVLALFQVSNMVLAESGIAAVTIAGIVVGNFRNQALEELVEFKEALTLLLIGLLFVLLAADVRLEQVVALGWPGLGVVLALILVVRPLAVALGTSFSELSWKERLFIAWIGPRGIVAAAVASFFAAAFAERGLSGGYELRALVFLVIAVTVVTAGLTGGIMAKALGLRRPSQVGWVFLGANALARALAKLFRENGQEVVCIDSNDDHCRAAEKDCTRVIYGNGLQSRTLLRAEIETRRGALALTANDEVNYLFVQKAKAEAKTISFYAALKTNTVSLTTQMMHGAGSELLFGRVTDVDTWNRRFKNEQVFLQVWKNSVGPSGDLKRENRPFAYPGKGLICAALSRNDVLSPMGDGVKFKKDDEVFLFVFEKEIPNVEDFMKLAGWVKSASSDEAHNAFSTSICHLDDS